MRTFWRRAVAREFVARDPMTPVARPKLEDKEADQLTDDPRHDGDAGGRAGKPEGRRRGP